MIILIDIFCFVLDYLAVWINPFLDRILANTACIGGTKYCSKHTWIAKGKRYGPNTAGLSAEIEDFYVRFCKIKEKELAIRLKLLQDFTATLRELWPKFEVVTRQIVKTNYVPLISIDYD